MQYTGTWAESDSGPTNPQIPGTIIIHVAHFPQPLRSEFRKVLIVFQAFIAHLSFKRCLTGST